MKNIFTYNEIISVVMEELSKREEKALYNIEEEEYNFSSIIKQKINSLKSEDYKEFFTHIEEIADSVEEFKTGELNELNNTSNEIINYIDKKWICIK